MSRTIRFVLSVLVVTLLGSGILSGQQKRTFAGASAPSPFRSSVLGQAVAPQNGLGGRYYGPSVRSYFYPSFGWDGGYFSPFLNLPSLPPPYPYMPNHWWVSPYPLADPRQEGYNPSAGYAHETVATLLLVTFPAKTRIMLDGVFVGGSDYLGPIQLPIGEHSLRVEAAGYEPSETVLKIEQPVLQQLEVRLNPARPSTKPAVGP